MLVSSRFGQRVYNHVKRMEKSEYIILLERFLKGETTHDEERILVDWFKSDVSRDELRNYIQRKWEIASNSSIPTDLKERMFRKIQSRIESVAVEKKDVGRFSLRNIMRYAAIGLLVICAGLGGHLLTRYSRSVGVEKDYLVFAAKGQKASVVLPDGSKVWLNSDSEIKYTNLYGDGERIISLDGEAYFEVHPDKKRKFVVDCNGLNVEALGTTFNVKGYSSDPSVTTSLLEGSVKVYNNKQTVMLTPDECVSYHKTLGRFDKSIIEDSREIDSWRRNVLYFRSASLEEIAKTLERMYGVEIKFKAEELKNIPFSGSIRNNSLSNVFYIISLTYPLTYELDKDIVIIDKK